ncbi:nitroreductase/quinone reductase family protein [Tsukamurella sp. 8F]|uniref:nitroreductase/quinone reductase family protein n=1 Tax=unclassified Tsukamurella TaxID=2633480 RepID=UPI0023B91A37|nr:MULTISPECIES: nitroreductase/quinone reductase family protein [unclassified Tsukamurella]MDF0528909.1 nitroreductase/quinone reductase family protein [Tsukamurella sp. 8J]MDF0586744.1 nitroreductase/quinone reductase family protein [Tsukamurella sp. 8F]
MTLSGEYAQEKAGWVAEQLAKIDETGTTDSVGVRGQQVVVFTYRGRKSGKLYRRPLMRVEKDGVYAAFASKGGAPDNPAWYYSFLGNPEVDVQDGTEIVSGVAREISGAEYDEWWERGVAAFPDYADYKKRTDRVIPIFLVEPKE